MMPDDRIRQRLAELERAVADDETRQGKTIRIKRLLTNYFEQDKAMADESMTGETLVKSLRARIAELEREQADLRRQITELRDAIRALLDEKGPSAVSQMRYDHH